MRSNQSYSGAQRNRYDARNTSKPINFFCVAPGAETVNLAGDFNDWHPQSHPMQRQSDGSWYIQVALDHGHHHYQFMVDGKSALDPKAMGIARNERNERVSLIAVS